MLNSFDISQKADITGRLINFGWSTFESGPLVDMPQKIKSVRSIRKTGRKLIKGPPGTD